MKGKDIFRRWPALSLAILILSGSALRAGNVPPIERLFYETGTNRTFLPGDLLTQLQRSVFLETELKMPDGRTIEVSQTPDGNNFDLSFIAKPGFDIRKWGLALEADTNEYFTGLMERVVDGPQQDSWASGITAGMNLHGETVQMLVKPTTSVYAPFYLSSRGYAVFVKSDWPGLFDFCKSNPHEVQIKFEGPKFKLKFYTGRTPAELVRAHALDAGPPFLPPKWMYSTWRWRGEIKNRLTYYDGTPVTGPFNSEFMEDVLLMKAYGIPLGIYCVDRPWGPGPQGCDDFEIDTNRFPHFAASIKWLNDQRIKVLMWTGPFFQGKMEQVALSRGYTLIGQKPSKNDYPLCDFTRPDAKEYWQDGVAKLLKLGVAGFKLGGGEEGVPDSGPYKVFDGRSIRENHNSYPVMYLKAAYEVAKKYRGAGNFVCMPRAAYTGSSRYGVFWSGNIGGGQNGLRAEIIAAQRAAVMGYPNWGSDTGGYNQQSLDTEMVGRWLEFSCFTPIMEIGPTDNRGFWDYHNPPSYDVKLIAIWRFYARLHAQLAGYSYAAARTAHKTGMPIVRPLFLADPQAPAAWTNWWTYLYGPDILVSPIWKKGQRAQEVYLPSGNQWRDAWQPDKVYDGGAAITVHAELHQLPIFVRVGSRIKLGNLNQEWSQSVAVANTRPDLKKLDAGVKAWYDKNYSTNAPSKRPFWEFWK